MKLREFLRFIENIRVFERKSSGEINYILECNELHLSLYIIKNNKTESINFGFRSNIDFSDNKFSNIISPYLDMKVLDVAGINDIGGTSIGGQTLKIIVADEFSDENVTVNDLFNLMNQFKITYLKGVTQRGTNSVSYKNIGEACLSHNIEIEFYIKNAECVRVEKLDYYSMRPFLETKEYQDKFNSLQSLIIKEIFELEIKTYDNPVLKLLVVE